MSRHWMPLYIADYLADTRRLTLAEHGAYLLLIMEYWRNGGIPADDTKIARIIGIKLKEWMQIKPSIQEFFDDDWRHKRIDAELAKHVEISTRRQAAANKRWQCKSNASAYASASANGMRSQPQPHVLSSNEDNKPREASPLAILSECMSETTARDLIAHRQKLRKPLTARAAKLLAKDFVAYGNAEEAAEMMIKNGWQGFHPTWVTNQAARAGPSPNGRGGMASLLAKQLGLKDGREGRNSDEAVHVLSLDHRAERGNERDDGRQLSGDVIDLLTLSPVRSL
jgi:uncharacterized protein YdaU (DUF1376 family)